jgi:hypothetical protein
MIRRSIDDAVAAYTKYLATQQFVAGANRKRIGRLQKKYAVAIDAARRNVFQRLPLSRQAAAKLPSMAAETFCRKVFNSSDPGVVIAGFGTRDIFPKLCSMMLGGIADNFLRHEVVKQHVISHDVSALIIPFAQSEMVETFMEGIDPNCQNVIKSYLDTIFRQYPVDLLSATPSLTTTQKARLTRKFQAVGRSILRDFYNKLGEYQHRQHISPVTAAVEVLPKDLLAEMAESLVNLTSFKRRISMNAAETVGGPIDVAVISRGDGFIWIKRKHYFKPELNPYFLKNYFGERHGTRPQKA